MDSPKPQFPPRATNRLPLIQIRKAPPSSLYVICRTPTSNALVSDTFRAGASKLSSRAYKCGSPYPAGHQSLGFCSRRAGVFEGSNFTFCVAAVDGNALLELQLRQASAQSSGD